MAYTLIYIPTKSIADKGDFQPLTINEEYGITTKKDAEKYYAAEYFALTLRKIERILNNDKLPMVARLDYMKERKDLIRDYLSIDNPGEFLKAKNFEIAEVDLENE